MTDIVERLREWDHEAHGCECHEAADEITRLRAEVEAEKSDARVGWEAARRAEDQVETLRADNARLRDALRGVVVEAAHGDWTGCCRLCNYGWTVLHGERHAPGCLAAQEGER